MSAPVWMVAHQAADGVQLHRTSPPQDDAPLWAALAGAMRAEPGLLPIPAGRLRQQWRSGLSAVAADTQQIVSHISLFPLLNAAHRAALAARFGPLPEVDIACSMTGWTHRLWRRRGISKRLRQELYGTYRGLLVSRPFGLGAGPALHRLGWVHVAEGALPFVHSLMGWPVPGGNLQVRTASVGYPHLVPYNGPARSPFEAASSFWEGHIHHWVSDLDRARAVEERLQQVVGDLPAWRAAVVHVLGPRAEPKAEQVVSRTRR